MATSRELQVTKQTIDSVDCHVDYFFGKAFPAAREELKDNGIDEATLMAIFKDLQTRPSHPAAKNERESSDKRRLSLIAVIDNILSSQSLEQIIEKYLPLSNEGTGVASHSASSANQGIVAKRQRVKAALKNGLSSSLKELSKKGTKDEAEFAKRFIRHDSNLGPDASPAVQSDVNQTFAAIKDALQYNGIKEKIFEGLLGVYSAAKVLAAPTQEASEGNPELDISAEIRRDFELPLKECHSPHSYAEFIIDALNKLNKKKSGTHKNVYADAHIARHLLSYLAQLYQEISKTSPDNVQEPGFTDTHKKNIQEAFNNFYNVRLKDDLNNKLEEALVKLGEQLCDRLLNKKSAITKQSVINQGEHKQLKSLADNKKYSEYLSVLNDYVKQAIANKNIESNGGTVAVLEGIKRVVTLFNTLNPRKKINIATESASRLRTSSEEEGSPREQERAPLLSVQYPSSAGPQRIIESIQHPVSVLHPVLPNSESQQHSSSDFAQYLTALRVAKNSEKNPVIIKALESQVCAIAGWVEDKPKCTISSDNPAVNTYLAEFKTCIVQDLDKFLAVNSNSNLRSFTDIFRRSRNPHRQSAEKDLVVQIKSELSKLNKPSDFITFTEYLSKKIAEGFYPNFTALLKGIQQRTARKLAQIDVNLTKPKLASNTRPQSVMLPINAAASVAPNSSGELPRQSTELTKDNDVTAYQIVNNQMNANMVGILGRFKSKRQTSRDEGIVSFAKSIMYNGFWTTVTERFSDTAPIQKQQINYADYFCQLLSDCKTAEDYKTFITDSCFVINQLKKQQKQGVDVTDLLDKLRKFQEVIIKRFITYRNQPAFSFEQKTAICNALKYYDRKSGPKVEEIQKSMSKDLFDGEAYSSAGFQSQYENFEQTIAPQQGKQIQDKIDLFTGENTSQNNEAKIKLFALTLHTILRDNFIASSACNSNQVAGKSGTEAAVGNLVGKITSAVSVPGVAEVGKVVNTVLTHIDDQHRAEEHSNVSSSYRDFKQLDALLKETVDKAAARYAQQITELANRSVVTLAECAGARVIDYIKSGEFSADNKKSGEGVTKSERLVLAISNNELRHSAFPLTKKSLYVDVPVGQSSNAQISRSAENILTRKVGILFFRGDEPVYRVKPSDPNPEYGFILGTEEEADKYGFSDLWKIDPAQPEHYVVMKRRLKQPIESAIQVEKDSDQKQNQFSSAVLTQPLNEAEQKAKAERKEQKQQKAAADTKRLEDLERAHQECQRTLQEMKARHANAQQEFESRIAEKNDLITSLTNQIMNVVQKMAAVNQPPQSDANLTETERVTLLQKSNQQIKEEIAELKAAATSLKDQLTAAINEAEKLRKDNAQLRAEQLQSVSHKEGAEAPKP